MPILDYGEKISLAGNITFKQIKLDLKDILVALLSSETVDKKRQSDPQYYETQGQILCAVVIMAFDEMLVNPQPSKEVVDDLINMVLSQLTCTSVKLVSFATDALTFLANNLSKTIYLDSNVICSVIEKIVGTLNDVYSMMYGVIPSGEHSIIISKIFYCLLEWVMCAPREVIALPKIANMLCDVIDMALEDEGHLVFFFNYRKIVRIKIKSLL